MARADLWEEPGEPDRSVPRRQAVVAVVVIIVVVVVVVGGSDVGSGMRLCVLLSVRNL